MSQAVWGKGVWQKDIWGPQPDPVPPDPSDPGPGAPGSVSPYPNPTPGLIIDMGGRASIEISTVMCMTQLITYVPPPPKIVPLRNYRAVMSDFRVLTGIPRNPPAVDVSIPINVTVGTTAVPLPDLTRKRPDEIDTKATLRWIAESARVKYSAAGTVMRWWDITNRVAWTAYGTYQPLFADDYSYQVPKQNSAEVINRGALVFDADYGNCMNTSVSTIPTSGADAAEFVMVVWSHPLASGVKASSLLDTGNEVRGVVAMPFTPGDTSAGMRQGLQRYQGGLTFWQDNTSFPVDWAQISSGRPVLIRVRFGKDPILECWGPSGTRQTFRAPPQKHKDLSTNYVLGRAFNLVSKATNAGMHLMEINYYDHPVDDADMTLYAQSLTSCYAVSS